MANSWSVDQPARWWRYFRIPATSQATGGKPNQPLEKRGPACACGAAKELSCREFNSRRTRFIKRNFFSVEVSQYISAGIRAEGLTAIECPLADGGEGTLDVLLLALKGERQSQSVQGLLGQQVVARWGWVAEQRLAIIEVAAG